MPKRGPAPRRTGDAGGEQADAIHPLESDTREILSRGAWPAEHGHRLAQACNQVLAKFRPEPPRTRPRPRNALARMLCRIVRMLCPEPAPPKPPKPGEVAGEISIPARDLERLIATAAGADETPQVVWSDGTNELLVDVAGVAIETAAGLIHVFIPVATEDTGPQRIAVTFATGSADGPAGLVFATETQPDGPPEIVTLWGEFLIALAWGSLLRTLVTLGQGAGSDGDGAGLIPADFAADRGGVTMAVMARHEMDRVPQ